MRRSDIEKVLIIGSGPIVIGQACEFDYSGTQACKALRECGYKIVLVNSNPATIMTDPVMADATYIEPLNAERIEQIIIKERPDALLPNLGGQTGLNLAMELSKKGILEKYGVKVIGVNLDAIERGEDRQIFKDTMTQLGIEMPRSEITYSLAHAEEIASQLGYPVVVRPAYTMGGTGGGLVYNVEELRTIVNRGLEASLTHQCLIEESVAGWEELEVEVVRDSKNQMIAVCFIENIDPMGVHTGDSFCSAPMLTIDKSVQDRLQEYAFRIVASIGVIGGTNVQFAHDPKTGRIVIIEINPRTSRSSALASKATGFPIALISAKLASGMTMDEIPYWRDGTLEKYTPSGDYIVIKFSRWAFEKFRGVEDKLGTQMKAVGEVMSIGKTYKETFQKAIRALENGRHGLGFAKDFNKKALPELLEMLRQPTSERQFIMYEALRKGATNDQLFELTKIKHYFIQQMRELVGLEEQLLQYKGAMPPDKLLIQAKIDGFSDKYLAKILGIKEKNIRLRRMDLGVAETWHPVPVSGVENSYYYYSSYNGKKNEVPVTKNAKKVMILGGGPNRIGQGIEFDYCCVHAAFAMRESGYETIMVNCNPETVSTDYDTSDRLYFEPLTIEDVVEIIMAESPVKGVIVQLGGQTPLKLAQALKNLGIPILGTDPDAIDLAEDRERFKKLIDKLKLKQPRNDIATSLKDALEKADKIGFPLVLRPSYVLGGRAMQIVYDREGVEKYMTSAVHVSGKNPVLLDSYLQAATEVDVDVLADGSDVYVAGIMEHIEEAGIHSGDSACVLPPHSLAYKVVREIEKQSIQLAKGLNVQGLMNIQFAVKKNRDTGENDIYVLEVNPRASRTVPFVAKATNVPVAKIAARIMAGEPLAGFRAQGLLLGMNADHTAVKAPVFPFSRFPGVDVLLGPEMKSTGEVIGIDRDVAQAYAKSQLGAGMKLPREGRVFLSVHDLDKAALVPIARDLADLGFEIVATGGTCTALQKAGLNVIRVNKVSEGQPHVVDSIINGDVSLIINTTFGPQSIDDGLKIRRAGLMNKVPYYTNMAAAVAAVQAIRAMKARSFTFTTLQGYFAAPTDLKQSA